MNYYKPELLQLGKVVKGFDTSFRSWYITNMICEITREDKLAKSFSGANNLLSHDTYNILIINDTYNIIIHTRIQYQNRVNNMEFNNSSHFLSKKISTEDPISR